jgi:hypothetical protein
MEIGEVERGRAGVGTGVWNGSGVNLVRCIFGDILEWSGSIYCPSEGERDHGFWQYYTKPNACKIF